MQLRNTILKYEEMAGLPSSQQIIDELAAAQGQVPSDDAEQPEASEQAAAAAGRQASSPAPADQDHGAAPSEPVQPAGATDRVGMAAGQAEEGTEQGACSAGQDAQGAGTCGTDAAATS